MLFFRQLDPLSQLRYIWWRLMGRGSNVTLRLRTGSRFMLRPRSAGNNDFGVAYEIFVHRFYDAPADAEASLTDPGQVRLIVDLGANVGLSCVHWLNLYRAARLIAVEPHPRHAAQCRVNLALNGGTARTELHEAAAGVATGRLTLSDEGTSSRARSDDGPGLEVPMIDVLALLAGQRIDILKIDIEGGEFSIMADPRFAALDIGAIVMEWHQCSDGRDDHAWCVQRLADCGFRIHEIFKEPSHGMFWALRGPALPIARTVAPAESSVA